MAEVLHTSWAKAYEASFLRSSGAESVIRRFSDIDRRSGADRRKAHKLEYFLNGGLERRSFKERRSQKERRANWVRVSEWCSVRLESLEAGKVPRRSSEAVGEEESRKRK